MKIIERVNESIIRSSFNINEMQYSFVSGRVTANAILIFQQMHKKHLEKRKPLYFAFGDLKKAFDIVPRKVIWWVMQKLSIEEWKIWFIQAMNANAASSVRMNNTCSEKFVVKVGIH